MNILFAITLVCLVIVCIAAPLTGYFLWLSSQYTTAAHYYRMAQLSYNANDVKTALRYKALADDLTERTDRKPFAPRRKDSE